VAAAKEPVHVSVRSLAIKTKAFVSLKSAAGLRHSRAPLLVWVKNPGCTWILFTVIFARAEPPATPAREIFGMNPKSLRAGKAVEPAGQSPSLPATSAHTSSPPEAHNAKTSPSQSVQSHKIPQILFEGAEPAMAQKFDLGHTRHMESSKQQEAKLPDAYGTGKLLLNARDPHGLFAHWDLTGEQQRHYNSLSADGRLTLRAYAHTVSNQPAVEVPVDPESRHLFLDVERAGTSYVAELGYYQRDRNWRTVATSAPTTTPPDAPSGETSVVFSTPHDRRTNQATAHKEAESPTKPADPAIIPVSAPRWPFESEAPTGGEPNVTRRPHLPEDPPPFVKRGTGKPWTHVQERLLAEMIRISSEGREWISSGEIAELVRRGVELPTSSPEMPWPAVLVNVSSSTGGEQAARKGFWFNVNAELIIYGATEPNAQVTVGGRPIKLRPDGTFSCHFALPDGQYVLAAAAVSPEGELRQAEMNFSRHTNYSGEVGAHPQNPALEQTPQPE
jgi:hypothetical protein